MKSVFARREVLAIVAPCLAVRALGQPAPAPRDLVSAVSASYRRFNQFQISVTSALGDSASKVTLALRPPVAKYSIEYPLALGQLILWSDGKVVRTFESKKKRFYEGGARDGDGQMVLDLLRTAATRYWHRFAALESERVLSRKIQSGSLRRNGQPVPCARIVIAGPTSGENPSTEELWIGETSGIVLRSLVRWPLGADKQQITDWMVVRLDEIPESELSWLPPNDAVKVEKPAFPGK